MTQHHPKQIKFILLALITAAIKLQHHPTTRNRARPPGTASNTASAGRSRLRCAHADPTMGLANAEVGVHLPDHEPATFTWTVS
jgi:hypothetical protein